MALDTQESLFRHKLICGFLELNEQEPFNSMIISSFVAFVAFGTAIAQAVL
jgi:hypothetical protein